MSKVLVVDSDFEFLNSLDQQLKQYQSQFEVRIVSDGQAAVEVLDTESICVLVAGLKISKIDSFSLLAHVVSNYPKIPCIAMVPYKMPEMWQKTGKQNNLIYLQKPFEINQLFDAIMEGLDIFDEEEKLNGVSVSAFFPLIRMEEKTCLLEVKPAGKEKGLLYFEKGLLCDADYDKLNGEQSALELVSLKNPEINFKDIAEMKTNRRIKAEFQSSIMGGSSRTIGHAALESGASERQDAFTDLKSELVIEEEAGPQGPAESSVTQKATINKGEDKMAEITETLQKFQSVDGFQAVGAFSPNGEMVAEVNPSGLKIAELGALANDVLLKAQKATEIMGVGRGQMVHVEAPKAHIVARCLNEATDFAATASGRAHVHMVVVLEKECNLAMAKMKVDGVIQEIAAFFR